MFEKIYKAIRMSYLYQINCELTPEQSKILLDILENITIVTESGERIKAIGTIEKQEDDMNEVSKKIDESMDDFLKEFTGQEE